MPAFPVRQLHPDLPDPSSATVSTALAVAMELRTDWALPNASMPDVRSNGLDTGRGRTVSARGPIVAPCAQYCNGPVGMEPGMPFSLGSVAMAELVNSLHPSPALFRK